MSTHYAKAWAVLSPRLQGGINGEQSFADGDATSYDFGVPVLDASHLGPGRWLVGIAFTSLRDAEQGTNGDLCDNWTLNDTMIQASDGTGLIDATKPRGGQAHTTC